jgi:prevent-host-death family protein
VTQTEVGIRELKAHLGAYLRRVKAGETVIVTERGQPIARIVPLSQSWEAQLEVLRQTGVVAWNGKRLAPLAPVARAKGERTVAELLLEGRR